jgi:hypothetical protein
MVKLWKQGSVFVLEGKWVLLLSMDLYLLSVAPVLLQSKEDKQNGWQW